MNKTCLVTGATGHIGSALVRLLAQDGWDIRIFALPGDSLASLGDIPVRVLYGDIREREALQRAVDGCSVVFHLAGLIGIGSLQRKQMRSVNVDGTRTVAAVCREAHVRLLYTSSVHAIAEKPRNKTIVETASFDPCAVHGAYGRSKAAATAAVLDACQQGLDAVIVHPSGVIGPYETSLSHMGTLIATFAAGHLPAYLKGAYDFVDVRDVAFGMLQAAVQGRRGQCYILSGTLITVKEMLTELSRLSGKPLPKVCLPYWLARCAAPFCECYYALCGQKPLFTSYSLYTLHSNALFSNRKAREELGFAPRRIEETLRDAYAWIQRNGLTTVPKRRLFGRRTAKNAAL